MLIEDEEEMADLVQLYLENEGFKVVVRNTGKEGLKTLKETKIDLAILDIMLPDMSGLDICQQIRKTCHYPIIMLTAKGEELDRITGLTLGADDYVTKPFKPLELVARVKAQLRRSQQYNQATKQDGLLIDYRGLIMNGHTRECQLNEKDLFLTPIEFSILWELSLNRGIVISGEELFEQIWQEKYFKVSSNTIMVHIRHIRQKMNDSPNNSKFIKTVWGVGYKID